MGSGNGPGAAVNDQATKPTQTAPATAFAALIGSGSGAATFIERLDNADRSLRLSCCERGHAWKTRGFRIWCGRLAAARAQQAKATLPVPRGCFLASPPWKTRAVGLPAICGTENVLCSRAGARLPGDRTTQKDALAATASGNSTRIQLLQPKSFPAALKASELERDFAEVEEICIFPQPCTSLSSDAILQKSQKIVLLLNPEGV